MTDNKTDNRSQAQKLKAKARFFEAQWLDLLRADSNNQPLIALSKQVPDSFVVSDYYQAAAKDILQVIQTHQLAPKSMLEVGPALGRTCYELAKGLPSLENLILIEPSELFFDDLQNILLHGKTIDLLYVNGKQDVGRLSFNTEAVASACRHLKIKFLNDKLNSSNGGQKHDLVVCLNVIDQAEQPQEMIQQMQQQVKPGGLFYLSCTYQWQKKLISIDDEAIDDISTCFAPADWQLLHENELEYKLRYHERFAHAFLSHGVIYQKM